MKYFIACVVIPVILMGSLSEVYAWQHGKPVTPYGDFCPRCTKYGICKSIMSREDARKALMDYYHKKELNVELERKTGRFIRARIKHRNEVVDLIIFDRRTGRVRSIY